MTPQPAEAQAVRETYALLRLAAARKQPVTATYDGLRRLPVCWAGNQADSICSAVSLEEVAIVVCR